MANIFINALQLSGGGGKNILDNYIKRLYEEDLSNQYFILTPNYLQYKIFTKENLTVIDLKNFFKRKAFFIILYTYVYPRILSKYEIKLVFNFGDIVIPTKVDQIYFFDWAYAVYSAKNIWKGMSLKNLVVRKLKVFLIKRYINQVRLTLCQTENISQRLKKQFKLKNIKTIATPLSSNLKDGKPSRKFTFPREKKVFVYPSSFASHKNFEVILKLGKLIKRRRLPFLIVLTIDEEEAKEYLARLKTHHIDCIYNTGKLELKDLSDLYRRSDALLFPSLLESYGLPYIEAMFFKKPILTSDLDFARAICGNVAFYFNPYKIESILSKMITFADDDIALKEKIAKGQDMIRDLPDWEDVFFEFEQQIDLILRSK